MANTKRSHRADRSVENIKKITNAMQLVAAAKLNQAQDRAQTVRPYAGRTRRHPGRRSPALSATRRRIRRCTMEFSYADGPRVRDEPGRLFSATRRKNARARPGHERPRVVRGSFNTNLIRRPRTCLSRSTRQSCAHHLGKKGHTFFQRRSKSPVILSRDGISDKLSSRRSRKITGKLIELYVNGEVDSALFHLRQSPSGRAVQTSQRSSSCPSRRSKAGTTDDNVHPRARAATRCSQTLIPLYATTAVFPRSRTRSPRNTARAWRRCSRPPKTPKKK